jgi:hypothetical protein
MEGSPDDLDDARAAGQAEVGDGLSLYQKYRGVVVSEGGANALKRLDPKKKTHFVIDAKQALDLGRWERTTDTLVYRVELGMTRNRQVNFNASHALAGAKYAARLEVTPGMVDPDTLDDLPLQLGYTRGGQSPGGTDVCRVFPDRIRAKIARIAESIQKGVDQPGSEDGDLLRRAGISPDASRAQLAALTPARKEQLAQSMIALVALHESIHACSVAGHGPVAAFGKEWEETDDLVDAACPMQYLSNVAWRQFLLYGKLGGSGTLCQTCARSFNVKN